VHTIRFYTLLGLSLAVFMLAGVLTVSAAPTCQISARCIQATGALGQLKTFEGNPRSTLRIAGDEIQLDVCADNIPGNRVYVTLYRPATPESEAQLWHFQRADIADRCTTFSNMQGDEVLELGVFYYSVASMNPITRVDATAMRTACFNDSDGLQFCDPVFLEMDVDVS
jgi:hypothetical protein